MANDKKYYYLKVKENFFDSEQMIILEAMQDGYLYSNILLKLYLRSLKNEGKLMFNDRIPYNSTILAQVVRHSVGVVEKSINVFKEFGLIDIMDNGAIYMLDIQNYIGASSSEADRKREYRDKITEEKGQKSGQLSAKCPDKTTPELKIELELDLELDLESKKEKDKKIFVDNSIESQLSLSLKNLILTNNPNARVPDNLNSWAIEINRMIRIDKRTPEQIASVIEFSQKDSFWMANILSAGKLREKFDALWLKSNASKISKTPQDYIRMVNSDEL